MSNLAWPAYPLAFLHDAARCLALIHQRQLQLNARARLQISSVSRLAAHLSLCAAVPPPRSEAQSPSMGFLLGLLGRAGWLGAVEDELRLSGGAFDWLALPASRQIDALRQVWWRAPTLDGRWLPATRHQRSQTGYWRRVVHETCAWLVGLSTEDWTAGLRLHDHLTRRGLPETGAGGNLSQVRQARTRRTWAVADFLLDFTLPVLGLVEINPIGTERRLRPTPDGQAWLRAALDRAGPPGEVALELLVPGPSPIFPEPSAAPVQVGDDLVVSVDLPAPAAFTFELAHFAELLSPGPPARYHITRASLEQALSWGYDLSEIRFLLLHFSQAPLPPGAAAQLDAWAEELQRIRYQPGYRLLAASPAVVAALRQRPAFRRRTQPLASGRAVWVCRDEAAGLVSYLRRRGYTLVPAREGIAAPAAQACPQARPLPWPALRRALPLAPLLVALRTYRHLRRAIPALAELGVEELEEALAAALSPDQEAAVEQLVSSHAALATEVI
jgi:hypothetical protein